MENNNFITATISQQMCLIGYPQFKEVHFKTLCVGDLVKKIGSPGPSGKITSSHRVMNLAPPLKYAGRIDLHDHNGNPAECVAFRIPPDAVTGWNTTREEQPMYMIFYVGHDEVEILNTFTSKSGGSIRIYPSVFEICKLEVTNKTMADWAERGSRQPGCEKTCGHCPFDYSPDDHSNQDTHDRRTALNTVLQLGEFQCIWHPPDDNKRCGGFYNAKRYLLSITGKTL